jgi:hypothetical protein
MRRLAAFHYVRLESLKNQKPYFSMMRIIEEESSI